MNAKPSIDRRMNHNAWLSGDRFRWNVVIRSRDLVPDMNLCTTHVVDGGKEGEIED